MKLNRSAIALLTLLAAMPLACGGQRTNDDPEVFQSNFEKAIEAAERGKQLRKTGVGTPPVEDPGDDAS